MAVDFPSSPTLNDIYTFGGKSWQWNGAAWESYGTVSSVFGYEHSATVTSSYTIASGKNVISCGPITINSGATVTISSGANWGIF